MTLERVVGQDVSHPPDPVGNLHGIYGVFGTFVEYLLLFHRLARCGVSDRVIFLNVFHSTDKWVTRQQTRGGSLPAKRQWSLGWADENQGGTGGIGDHS